MPESPGPARKPRTSQTTCTREQNQTTCTRAQKQTACTRAQLAGAAELRFAEEPLRGRAGCLGQAATVRWRAPGRMPALPVSGPGVTDWIQRSSRQQPAHAHRTKQPGHAHRTKQPAHTHRTKQPAHADGTDQPCGLIRPLEGCLKAFFRRAFTNGCL